MASTPLVTPLIQNSATLESLKQRCDCNWTSTYSATDTLLISLASNSVDSSSSLGIDVLLAGETCVFDTTKLTGTSTPFYPQIHYCSICAS